MDSLPPEVLSARAGLEQAVSWEIAGLVATGFRMIRWLPCWRTAANPCCSRIRQTSGPERTRSLPNQHLNLSHENFVVKAPGDFGRGGSFEEQRERLNEVDSGFFNGRTLARNIELRAQRRKPSSSRSIIAVKRYGAFIATSSHAPARLA